MYFCRDGALRKGSWSLQGLEVFYILPQYFGARLAAGGLLQSYAKKTRYGDYA